MLSTLLRKIRHWFRFRDAVTGRFTTKDDAKARPRETVREDVAAKLIDRFNRDQR